MTREPEFILATDCGSTTTKAILFARRLEGYRLAFRGEAPTTVEAPFDDVTVGVLNAVTDLEELSGRTLIEDGAIVRPAEGNRGVDVYTSSNGAGTRTRRTDFPPPGVRTSIGFPTRPTAGISWRPRSSCSCIRCAGRYSSC